LRHVSLASIVILVALLALSQASCGGKGGETTFIKMFTSCNLQGGLEPCG
jgi:hypothetical protein